MSFSCRWHMKMSNHSASCLRFWWFNFGAGTFVEYQTTSSWRLLCFFCANFCVYEIFTFRSAKCFCMQLIEICKTFSLFSVHQSENKTALLHETKSATSAKNFSRLKMHLFMCTEHRSAVNGEKPALMTSFLTVKWLHSSQSSGNRLGKTLSSHLVAKFIWLLTIFSIARGD